MGVEDLRKRIQQGDEATFADPSLPLLLLSGSVNADDARDGAVAYLVGGGAAEPWLLDLAEAWWQEHSNPQALCSLLGRLGARAGQGSAEHRRAVLVACLCARTALAYADRWRREVEGCLEDLERWAWGDRSVELSVVHSRAEAISKAAYAAAPASPMFGFTAADAVCLVAGVTADAARAAAYASLAAAGDPAVAADAVKAAAVAASAASGADVGDDAASDAALGACLDHQSALAGLIRAAVPRCPLAEVLRAHH